MSGGVDSSVAASLLMEKGYEVVGVSMNFLSCDRPIDRSCCSARDREDARLVCEALRIKHYTVDCRSVFNVAVITPFVDEYLRGRTPSPCILCNEYIKFKVLLDEAEKKGANYIATGHYARISPNGEYYKLLTASDSSKDQSYFLFRLSQKELPRLLFPLGNLTKAEVRNIAADKMIPTHKKPESQEVCFVPDDNYVTFIENSAPERISGEGDFVDTKGNILGRHKGIHAYTIGQRRGLGFGIGRRQYVVRIDPVGNQVVLGNDGDLMREDMIVRDVGWVSGRAHEKNTATVRIRSTHKGGAARLESLGNNITRVHFNSPERAVAPGQAAVFYDGEEVLGGGWIE